MWYYILWIAAILVVLIFLEIVREISSFKVTHYEIHSPKLAEGEREQKIVFLSDLHNHSYGKENKRLFQAVSRQKPDLILVGGDMLVGKKGVSSRAAQQFMCRLPELCPVFYVNGNHEQRMREHPDVYGNTYFNYKETLEKAGVKFLVNEKCMVDLGRTKAVISGLEVPESCYRHGRHGKMTLAEAKQRIGEAGEGAYQILLVHQPDFMPVYKAWGADLILSGHLHGGIIRIPGLGGVISPQMGLFPKYSGSLYREGDTSMVVSRGLGTHTVNIRLLNPAEMIVLHIGGSRA